MQKVKYLLIATFYAWLHDLVPHNYAARYIDTIKMQDLSVFETNNDLSLLAENLCVETWSIKTSCCPEKHIISTLQNYELSG